MSDSPSIRDSLSAAFDTALDLDAETSNVAETSPTPTVEAAEVPDAASSSEALGTDTATETSEEKAARDEKGRFAKAVALAADAKAPPTDTKAPAVDAKAPPVETKPDMPKAPVTKAPQSWTPAAREHWGKLPAEVQAEVAKRERETAVALQTSVEARRVADTMQQVVTPYLTFLRGEGVGDPFQAINALLGHAQVLRQGTPQVKAQTIVNWIKQFDVPVDVIDSILTGQAQGPGATGAGAQGPGQSYQPPVNPDVIAQQVMERLTQQRQVVEEQRQVQAVQEFGAAHEFLDDVRQDMADLLEGAARRGLDLTMEEAYARACRAHPEVSRIMMQREAAKTAETARAATQRTRAAASSIRSQPTGSAAPRKGLNANDDRLADIRAAFESAGT